MKEGVLIVVYLAITTVTAQQVTVLTDANSNSIYSGEWFIKAYAPWCGACRAIAKPWADLGVWATDTEFNIAEVDITANHYIGNELMVTRIPMLFHVKDGLFRQYKGGRDLASWQRFLQNGEYTQLEPIAWYKAPGSVTMTAFGKLISFALNVHELHKYLTNELSIPVVLSVIILIVAPIVLIIAFALLSVLLLHFVLGKPKDPGSIGPQRPRKRMSPSGCSDVAETGDTAESETSKKNK